MKLSVSIIFNRVFLSRHSRSTQVHSRRRTRSKCLKSRTSSCHLESQFLERMHRKLWTRMPRFVFQVGSYHFYSWVCVGRGSTLVFLFTTLHDNYYPPVIVHLCIHSSSLPFLALVFIDIKHTQLVYNTSLRKNLFNTHTVLQRLSMYYSLYSRKWSLKNKTVN